MYEQKTEVTDARIPKGFKITYHELRGYDSPDRWYEVHRGKRKIGRDFGTLKDALSACTPTP